MSVRASSLNKPPVPFDLEPKKGFIDRYSEYMVAQLGDHSSLFHRHQVAAKMWVEAKSRACVSVKTSVDEFLVF